MFHHSLFNFFLHQQLTQKSTIFSLSGLCVIHIVFWTQLLFILKNCMTPVSNHYDMFLAPHALVQEPFSFGDTVHIIYIMDTRKLHVENP